MTHHKISASTLARTAALALALTNQVLSAVGKPMLPIEIGRASCRERV